MMIKGKAWKRYTEFKTEFEKVEKDAAYWAEKYIDCPNDNAETKHYYLRNNMFWKDKMLMLINNNIKMYERLLKERA